MANAHHNKEKYILIASKTRGQKRSQATKKRISQALMGHKHSPETLAKMRKPRSKEGRMNISKAMMGKTPWNKGKTGIYSEETLTKLRNANLGKRTPIEIRLKLRDGMINHFKSLDPNYIPPLYEDGIKARNHEQMRRDRIKRNGGSHTKEQWEHLKGAYDFRCAMCNKKEPEIELTKDHILPIRNGGNDDIANIQPLCRRCNSKKH